MVGGGITYEKRQRNSSPFLSVSISSFWPCVKRRRCCDRRGDEWSSLFLSFGVVISTRVFVKNQNLVPEGVGTSNGQKCCQRWIGKEDILGSRIIGRWGIGRQLREKKTAFFFFLISQNAAFLFCCAPSTYPTAAAVDGTAEAT